MGVENVDHILVCHIYMVGGDTTNVDVCAALRVDCEVEVADRKADDRAAVCEREFDVHTHTSLS